jgi:7-cyano-7-deazaguanine reductase
MKDWSDETILKVIKNTCRGHEHKIICPEVTFYGFPNQPDIAKLIIEILPGKTTIELKSLKMYLLQFRESHISYERILDVIFNDLIYVYKPNGMILTLETMPRGGISSILRKAY